MKYEKIGSRIITAILSYVIAIAGLGCLVTAFSISVADWQMIFLWCGGLSLFAVVFFSFRWGSLVLTSLSLVLLNALLRLTELLNSIEALVYRITYFYDSGYHWGYIRWSQEDLSAVSMDAALILLGSLVICAIAWTLLRKKPLVFAVLGGLFPLVLCCLLLDTVPHNIPLLLLTIGLSILILTHSTCRRDDGRANRITAKILVSVILFCGLIFVWAPTVSYDKPAETIRNWVFDLFSDDSGGGNTGTGNTGTGNTGGNSAGANTGPSLDLSRIGPRNLSRTHIMKILSDYRGTLYLRAQAYDTYTGTGWETKADTVGEGGWPLAGGKDEMLFCGEITITSPTAGKFLYVPYYIDSDDWTALLQGGALVNEDGAKKYSFSVVTFDGTAAFQPLSDFERETYLSLPDDTLAAAVLIVEEILSHADADTTALQAQAIADYVRNSADYDLNTQRMPEDATDFALWFLESSETGYCVHFATAATVLLRAADIPARYISGYMAETDSDGTTNILANQAHSWVEYLDPDRGWTVLEATPAVEPEPTEPPETTAPTEQTRPTAPTEPTQKAPTEAPLPGESQTTPSETLVHTPVEPVKPRDMTWLKVVLWILLVWAVVAGQYRLRLKLRRYWFEHGKPKQQAVRRWKYIRCFAWIIRQRPPEQLHQLTEKAVFSQHTLTQDELRQYDHWIKDAHRHVQKKPWPVKILLKLLLALE